ncbi:hypothetical protein ACHAXT_011782 [Thalassiosira profunda]
MKIIFVVCASAALASAFTAVPSHRTRSSTQLQQFTTAQTGGYVNVADIYSPRDVQSMEQWALLQCGVQKADGVELYSEDGGNDYSLLTQSGAAAGETLLFAPADATLNSDAIKREFGDSLWAAEEMISKIDDVSKDPQGTERRLTLFYLMVQILVEYEKGTDSLWFPWLNSLPRQFYNGVSMTRRCYKLLPPYASRCTSNERLSYSHFARAIQNTGCVPISDETKGDDSVLKWAYNVALTRYHDVWQPRCVKIIAPMADMINHAAEPNCGISVDEVGNVQVLALYDIPAGSPLTVQYLDPTNPTPIFAQYGFLPQDCSTIFCKATHLVKRMRVLGYDFSDLLLHTETGEVAPPVWDVFLLDLLQKNDPGAAHEFTIACIQGDESTKEQYHGQYFAYTLEALKEHVYSLMSDCETLSQKAQTYDLATHPRVPVIVAHNQLASQTLANTAALLEQMG